MDITAIGRQVGLTEAQTQAALDALVPVIASGMRRSAQDQNGLQDLLSSLLGGGHDRSLRDEEALGLELAKPRGDQVLAQIFGNNKDMSREVAQRLSVSTGIGSTVLKKLLPVLATVVAGWVAKQMSSGGAASPDSGVRPGGAPGSGRQTRNDGGLGDVVRDILGGGQREQTPVPLPRQPSPGTGSGGSLEDILGDILGGRAQNSDVVVRRIPADQMGDILRDIFGGNLPGGGSADIPRHQPSEEALRRGRTTLDDVLGRGSRTGNAADDLLDSVERSLRERR